MNSRRDEYMAVRVEQFTSMKAAFAAHLTQELIQAVYLEVQEAESETLNEWVIADSVKDADDE